MKKRVFSVINSVEAYIPQSSTLGTSVTQVPFTFSVHSFPTIVGTHTV